MIRTIGLESERLQTVTDDIDKFIDDLTKQHGSTFRLIDIKFSSASKPLEGSRKDSNVNYSALVVYEV